MRLLNGLCLALCGACLSSSAQQAAPAATQPAATRPAPPTATQPARPAAAAAPAGALTFDAVVRSKDGKPVAGLQQQDFTLKLDKKPLPIAAFRQTVAQPGQATPTEVILLIDTVNTQPADAVNARKQTELYLQRNEGKLSNPVTLIVLADSGIRILPGPTRDGNALAATLEKTALGLRQGQDTDKYGELFRFEKSIGGLSQIAAYEAKRPGRKMLIWISPGWPMLVQSNGLLITRVKTQLFTRLVDISTSLRQAHITLYNVDPVGLAANGGSRNELYHDDYLKGVPTASKMEFGDLGLQTLVRMTGGRVVTSSNEIARAIADAASGTEVFYTFTIDPGTPQHPNEYRGLALSVDKPGLSVTSMTGYYAQP